MPEDMKDNSTVIEDEGIVIIHDDEFESGEPFRFPDEGEEPENPYSVEELIEKIHIEFAEDFLYHRVRSFKLLGKIVDPDFVEVLNPYRAYSVQEACDILGGIKKTTVYSWVRELERVQAIDILEKSDAKPLSWKGIVQLKMYYALKQNGGQGNREIINYLQSKNGAKVRLAEEEGPARERLDKLSDEVRRLQFITAHMMKTLVGVEIDPMRLLDSPEKLIRAADTHAESQRQREIQLNALFDTVQTQNKELEDNKGEVTELVETIERMKADFENAKLETDERYIKQMEELKQHFDTQIETISKNQKKSLLEKLFGK